jgi:hypothetical protein|tara:strand:- start:2389 stop:2568 length:180 start_codon:yes stop_codon:yes gene_type:complete
MPQIGNDSNRVKIRNNQNNRIFGDTGSWYKAENKKKYNDNYDAIFGKKDKTTSETTQAK